MYKRTGIILAVMALIVFACNGCWTGGIFNRRVKAGGQSRSQNFSGMGDFSAIVIDGAMRNLRLELVNDDCQAQIETDENYFEYLDVFVQDSILYIRGDNNRSFDKKISVQISAPVIDRLEFAGGINAASEGTLVGQKLNIVLSGAADILFDLDYQELSLDVSGAGDIILNGYADTFRFHCAGASELDALNLTTRIADIGITGAGTAGVYCDETLSISITGAGEVRYRGDATVNRQVLGAGSIRQVTH